MISFFPVFISFLLIFIFPLVLQKPLQRNQLQSQETLALFVSVNQQNRFLLEVIVPCLMLVTS